MLCKWLFSTILWWLEITIITLSIGTDKPEQNSVDPDQMLQNAASDQGLHCLSLIQQIFDPSTSSKMDIEILGQVY